MQRKRLMLDIPWPAEPLGWFVGVVRSCLPSRGNVVFTLLVVSALFWAQIAGAIPAGIPSVTTSTSTIAYQGRLADSSGNPVTATVPMVFRLYNLATGGTPLWEEVWTGSNSVQVSDGLFNVMLGSLFSIPQSIVTGNSNLWLGITVNADDEMQPRVQLGSVPFAVQALTVPDGSITQTKAPLLIAGPTANTRVEWGLGHNGQTILFSKPFSEPPVVIATAVENNSGWRITASVHDVTTHSFILGVEYSDGGAGVEGAYWVAIGR